MARRSCVGRLITAAFTSVLVVGGVSLGAAAASVRDAAATTTVAVDGASPGRTFDGVGGLSAGASSRLLIDYPEPERSQILDYLFKPDYGAALQILKVEIGGDTNSTDGTEPSHMRTPTQVNCNRGYEWWLMEQAKDRNPNIKLSALAWGTPGWIGEGKQTVWTDSYINYLLSWLGCADQHHVHIDYLGGWNEKGFNAAWYVKLRAALDSHGYRDVKIVADDGFGWNVADAMASDPAFDKAVDVVGQHYPCGAYSPSSNCPSTATARGLNKPLWASEQGSLPYDSGAIPLARGLNRQYIDGRMTATVNWSLIWSAYSGLPFQGVGLMQANAPWSGQYVVGQSIWVMAHTAQFTEPGWRYLDNGSERLPGGSVVSLRAPNSPEWSSVAETLDATAPQQVQFDVSGGLSTGTVQVWATDLRSNNPADWFVRQQDLTAQAGQFTATLQPGYVYTFTTTTGQSHGTAASPPAGAWKLPYTDNFDSYPADATPRYFSDLGGSFQTAACVGRPGGCLQQSVTEQPVKWDSLNNMPVTVVGDPQSWSNYRADVDVYLPKAGYVELDGRMLGSPNPAWPPSLSGYHFRVDSTGKWSVYREGADGTDTTLTSGTTSFTVGTWHQLSLQPRGTEITAYLDNHELGTVLDATYPVGQVGVEGSPWVQAQFDNLRVRQVPVYGQAPKLAVQPVQIRLPGGSTTVSVTVTNPSQITATEISAQLQVPKGWAQSTLIAPPNELEGGHSAHLEWRLTAPATASPGTYPGHLALTYRQGDERWIASTPVSIYVATVPQSQMSATATSAQDGYPAANAIDGNPGTLWHTEYSPNRVNPPQSITLDLGGTYNVGGLLYLPRQDKNTNGDITSYKVFVSSDGTTFTQAAAGNWALDGTQKSVDFTADGTRFVRLEGVQGGGGYVSAAELNVKLASPVEVRATATPSILPPGQTATATATIRNTSSAAVDNVAANLSAPTGWSVTADGSTTFASLAAGQSATVRWQVQAPADAPAGGVHLPVTVTYEYADGNAAEAAQADLAVPYPSLPAAYNDVGITDDADTSPGDLAGAPGYSYSAQALAAVGLTPGAAVDADGVSLIWPDVPAGQPDNVICHGQTIAVSGTGTKLVFVGASNNGNGSGTGTITYTDGTTQPFTLQMSDWGYSAVQGDQLVATTSHWNAPPGSGPQQVSVYSTTVLLQGGKTPAYVTLPSTVSGARTIWIFAMGIG